MSGDLNDDELKDFNALISRTLIPRLIEIADKYNIDRDSMIKYAADILEAMAELATFKNYKHISRKEQE